MIFLLVWITRSKVISTPLALNFSCTFSQTVSLRMVSSSSCPEFVRLLANAALILPSPELDSRMFALMNPPCLRRRMLYATSCSSNGGRLFALTTVLGVLAASRLSRIARMIDQFRITAVCPESYDHFASARSIREQNN